MVEHDLKYELVGVFAYIERLCRSTFFLLTSTTHLIKIKVASRALKMLPFIKTRSISAWTYTPITYMWDTVNDFIHTKYIIILGNHHVISLSPKWKKNHHHHHPPQWVFHMFLLFLHQSFPIFINIFFSPSELQAVCGSTTQRDASTPSLCFPQKRRFM